MKRATVLAITVSWVAADPGGIRSADEGVGVEGGSRRGSGVIPAVPIFLQDKEDFFGCDRTQNMCDSCSRNCGCTTDNCSWNFVCYGTDRRGANGCFCKFDDDCRSGRCSKGLSCYDKLENGEGCWEDDDCKTGRCSKGLKCYDKLDNNEGCWEDDDCASGRCSKGLKCQDKVDNGEGCMESEDCKSLNCEWSFQIGTCRQGGCGKKIPFMATNVELTMDGPDHFWGYHSDNYASEFQFLKDIRYCHDAGSFAAYRIYGKLISPDEFKSAVEEELADPEYNYDHVLYAIHGFQTEPQASFMDAWNFHDKHDSTANSTANGGYLVIPVNWRNNWGKLQASYEYDRNSLAPIAGFQLANNIDAFKSSYSASAVVHSMGNYVLRNMAQNVESPEQIFQNIFMVSADARSDMFSTEFNPDAPKDMEAEGNTDTTDVLGAEVDLAQVELELPPEELKPNGGYAITNLANHVHVVWNSKDDALFIREAFQVPCLICWPGELAHIRNALGKYGDAAEGYMELTYFRNRVTFHNFSPIYQETWNVGDVAHSYQWKEAPVNLYKGYKFQKGADFPTEVANDQECVDASNCTSGFCSANDSQAEFEKSCKYGPMMVGPALATK